jgi:chemotaxis methyl-accepting protein methylase
MDKAELDQVYRGDMERLIAKIAGAGGLDLTQYRRPYVERRIAARLRSLNLHTYRQYARVLDADPDEYARLLDTLTINVTDFFRDPPVYELFRSQIVPEIVEAKLRGRHRMIRIWSAGCATGEEAYSLAMSFLDALGDNAGRFVLSVLATDIDPSALETAKRATYDIAKLEHVPEADRHFLDIGETSFTIDPAVASHVKFRVLDLFRDEPVNVVDVVFCRNVFIYFTREQQERVLELFWRALSHDGYLVLGRSEKMSPALNKRFEVVSGRERIYRKRPSEV